MNTIASIKNGDRIIYEAVFYEYHSKLYYFILSKTNSTFIAEEVTQLTFIKLWQFRANLNDEISLSAQLFRIAKTTLIDALRKETVVAKNQQNNQIQQSLANHIDDNINRKELQNRLHNAIYKLPTARRKVFELSRVEGLTYKEIAAELSLSVKTVEHHIALALKQLRHFMTLGLVFMISVFS